MIASLFLVAGVGIGYGVHSGSVAILVIGVWVFFLACTLAFMAGIARLGQAADRAAAERFEDDVQRGFGEQAHYKMFDNRYALPTAVRGSYPAEEDVE